MLLEILQLDCPLVRNFDKEHNVSLHGNNIVYTVAIILLKTFY